MANSSSLPPYSAENVVAITTPIAAFRPLIEEMIERVDGFPGWPPGKVALKEADAAACIGVKPHVLRDTRIRQRLPHCRIGRTVTYTAEQLKSVLERMATNT